MVLRVLEKRGATLRSMEMLYKVVSQTVLLYGSESWVITGAMIKVLEAFHRRIMRRITVNLARRVGGEGW